MDREKVRELRGQLEAALAPLAERTGLAIRVGNASYMGTCATFKLEVAEKSADGTTLDKEAACLSQMGEHYGLPKDALGKEFHFRGHAYKATGLNPNSHKFPLLATRLSDGKAFKVPASAMGGKPWQALRFGEAPDER
jgi:hypothetical protein